MSAKNTAGRGRKKKRGPKRHPSNCGGGGGSSSGGRAKKDRKKQERAARVGCNSRTYKKQYNLPIAAEEDDGGGGGVEGADDASVRRPSWKDVVLPMPALEGGYNKGKRLVYHRQPRRYCCAENALRAVLPYVNFAAIAVVFVCIIAYRGPAAPLEPPPPPGPRRDGGGGVVAFNLIPTDKAAKTMKLSLRGTGIAFERLVHYDVCCYQARVFVCRGVTKNMAVDCVIERDEGSAVYALVLVNHVDMVGARCKLIWTEG